MVANVVGVKKPPWMEMDQWWRLWNRTGHRWIEKCNMNVLTAIRERTLRWAGHVARLDCQEICAKALRCRGLQCLRWRQLHGKEVEKDKWSGPHPKRFKNFRWDDMVSTEVSKFSANADGLAESVQLSTGWLQLAQDRGVGDSLQNLERAPSWCSQCGCETEIHQMPRGPKCLQHAGGKLLGGTLPSDGSEADHIKRNNGIQKSETGGQN